MPRRKFNVLIVHGHSTEWKKARTYAEEAGFRTRVLREEHSGDVLFNRLRKIIWKDIHAAVVLLAGDDRTANGTRRARQNVVFELGYCYGGFDSLPDRGRYKAKHAIIVLEEEGVESFADIAGLTTIRFKPNRLGLHKQVIVGALEKAYRRARRFYPELGA